METGIVFDIQRNSLNDGPGIRTAVFLKGCPLNCIWCHNEESIDPRPQLRYFPEKCTHCMECVQVCKPGAHMDRQGTHRVEFAKCTTNWDCLKACAYGALTRSGEQMTVQEVMSVVTRDLPYFSRSGGGLTLSGGEPLVQFDFAMALLKRAREKHIHTCLDTSGHVSKERLLATVQFTNLYLYDYKASDAALHRELTGVDNRLIRDNLNALCERGAEIILRCPVVPGVNDTEEHFAEIARLGRESLEIREVHILPYHSMGSRKAEQLGRRTSDSGGAAQGAGEKELREPTLEEKELREPYREEKASWEAMLKGHRLENFTIF